MSTPAPLPARIGIPPAPFDPWEEVGRLEFGADRTQASTIRQIVLHTPPSGRSGLEERLLGALAESRPESAGRAFICEMLGLIGSARSAAALGALLSDAGSAEVARQALERLSGPEADRALRNALRIMSGPALAGLIGTLASRGDREALPELRRIGSDSALPATVRETANLAIEHLERTAP